VTGTEADGDRSTDAGSRRRRGGRGQGLYDDVAACRRTADPAAIAERQEEQEQEERREGSVDVDVGVRGPVVVRGALPPSAPSAFYRHLRQHRNSWPTIDAAAATAAAKTIVSSACYEVTTQFRGINIAKRKRTYFTNYIVGADVKVKKTTSVRRPPPPPLRPSSVSDA